jgi:hypothetical protein
VRRASSGFVNRGERGYTNLLSFWGFYSFIEGSWSYYGVFCFAALGFFLFCSIRSVSWLFSCSLHALLIGFGFEFTSGFCFLTFLVSFLLVASFLVTVMRF